MQRYLFFTVLTLISTLAFSIKDEDSTMLSKSVVWRYSVDSIADIYGKKMEELVHQRNKAIRQNTYKRPLDVYALRMSLPPTFYSSSVLQQFSAETPDIRTDRSLLRMYLVNDALASMYVNRPEIVVQTDSQVEQAGTLRDDVHGSLTTDTKLSDKVVTVDLGAEMNEGVELVTRRPNFWKFSGSGSLQFTQNYFSENWYQGGENNYAFL
jgi:hypothetical protein